MRILRLFLLVLLFNTSLPGRIGAAVPTSGLEAYGTQVDDSELADMRGKFIRPDNITYFGIEMLTSWQSQDGITTQARLVISLDFAADLASASGDIVPQLLVSWTRDGDGSLDVANPDAAPLAIAVGGLDSVHGFVQHQQIAGSDNFVRNDMHVSIVSGGSASLQTDGMTPIDTDTTVQFADGDTVRFQLADNQVGMMLTEGSDAILQSVNGNLNQLGQHVLITSNFNDITNHMNAVVGIDPAAAQATQLNVQQAMSGMNGFGF